jgi:PucR C-terminal helix-turn-helix domain/GGDEF-like domain
MTAGSPPHRIVGRAERSVTVWRDTIGGRRLVAAILALTGVRGIGADVLRAELRSITMAAPSVDAQVMEIGSLVGRRLDEIAKEVTSSVRASVEFYRDTGLVSADELLASSTENIRFLFDGLREGADFDTSPAETTGTNRAAAGVPLPVVMDAFRVASHHLWDAMIEVAGARPSVGRDALLRATSLLWQAQDVYTDAMTAAYRRQAMQQALEDEAERSALTEALLQARVTDDRSLWEVAQLLRIPQKGPYVVIAAQCPSVGKQALPGIHAMLRSIDIFSAWRLLPDFQVGIAHTPTDKDRAALKELLARIATTRIGISPAYDDLADTAEALRYARVAVTAQPGESGMVTVFDDSILAVAAVSAPEVSAKLADLVLGSFSDLSNDEKSVLFDTFRAWVANDGSIPDTAGQLYCHPNTVRYRLHRIEERTGRSVSVPRQLAELCLAFEVHQTHW